ncbi:MAG: cupin domain-containing protein [Acidobacteria bacterium]|nr:cupin domain-containing protein [Acidobacteriota bacterium]MBV9475596.1 cupin domain-containing protein [Acidobacteriota bacterium]
MLSDVLSAEELAVLDALAKETIAPVVPPPHVRAQVLAQIARTPQLDERVPGPDESRTVRADEGRWVDVAPGVRTKKLTKDARRNTMTCLLELAPQSILPAHDHKGAEESYVVRGSCHIGGVALAAGDFHQVDAGSHHGDVVASADGCLLLITVDLADVA